MTDFQTFTVGRGRGADVRLPDPAVSRLHLEATVTADGRLFVIDAASMSGTFVRRGGEWRRIRQDFIGADETLRMGGATITAAELLERGRAATRGADGHAAGQRKASARGMGPIASVAPRRAGSSGEVVYQ